MDLRAAHARAAADREEAHARVTIAEETLAEARALAADADAICNGLMRAIELYEKPLEERASTPGTNAVVDNGAPEALVQANQGSNAAEILRPGEEPTHTNISYGTLRALGRPMDNAEIAAIAQRAGYDSSPEQIRSALTWHLKKGRVVRVAPATWALPREESQESFTPAVEAAGVSTAGGNGHSSRSNVPTGAEQGPQPAGQASL